MEGGCSERRLAVRVLLQKSPAVARVECRGARPGRRERKGAKGDRPEALAAGGSQVVASRLRHPVRGTRSRIQCGSGASGSAEQRLRARSVVVRRGPGAGEVPVLLSAGWWPRLGSLVILRPSFRALSSDLRGSPTGHPGAGAQLEVEDASASPPFSLLRTVVPPTAVSGAGRPGWQPKCVQIASGNQSSHGPLPLGALSLCRSASGPLGQSLGCRASQRMWLGRIP